MALVKAGATARVAYASISEKGTVNGAKVDQTGRELRISDYYSFGQSYYFRFTESGDAWWLCDIMIRLVNNNRIGYGQNDRLSLRTILLRNGWKSKQVENKCNCDCSSLVACAINCIYEKDIMPASTTTSTLSSCLKAANIGKVLKIRKDYRPMPGDIIWKPGKHVVVCVGYE